MSVPILEEVRANIQEAYMILRDIEDQEDEHTKAALDQLDQILAGLPGPDWLSSEEAAEKLCICAEVVLRLLIHGLGFKYQLFGPYMMIPPSELDRIPDDILQEIWDFHDDGPPTWLKPLRENLMAERK